MNVTPQEITLASLFELHRAEEFGIPKELVEFLLKYTYPWEILGRPLTAFLLDQIAAVPESERIRASISPAAVIDTTEGVLIGEGAIIEPQCFISGPTIIAPGATVRQGAYVRGSTYVAPGAVVGHATETKGTILFPRAKAAHFAYVGDSLLGVDTNLGAGTKLANLKFNHSEIIIRALGQRWQTGLKKFGAILGNRAQTGCNSVTNPGTLFLPDCVLGPNSTALGIITKRP